MYEKIESCPSCAHPKFDNFIICRDHLVSEESFALVKCKKCELIFTNPRPDEQSLPNYYESDEYISHSDKANSLINFLYKQVRKYSLRKKRKLISEYCRPGTLLDYGCGTGDFLMECEKNKWSVSGIEPNEKARLLASQKVNGSIQADLKSLSKGTKFDIITAWHVLEHVVDVTETLKRLRKQLENNGTLIIAMPNPNSYDAEHYKEYWAAYDVPRHLYHFTPESFEQLVKPRKLTIVKRVPLFFDSFYVSMLSEKYMGNKSPLVKGLLIGRKSNRKAKQTRQYSSLIYILKKKS